MASSTESYFAALNRQGRMPALARASGSIRFDVTGGSAGSWFVNINRGEVRASRDDAAADCTVRLDQSYLDALVEGRLNPMAALLRGDVLIEGDAGLLLLAQRMFPAPPRGTGPRETGPRQSGESSPAGADGAAS